MRACSVVSDSLRPMDCNPPGPSVHGTLQARILEWIAISYSRGSFWPRYQTRVSCVSCIRQQILHHCITWEAPELSGDPAMLLLSEHPQITEIRYSIRYLHISVRIGTIYNCQKVEATQVSIKRWIDKQNVVSTYTGILLSQAKEWNSETCYNMSEPSGHDSKLTKPAIKGQIFDDSTYMRNS